MSVAGLSVSVVLLIGSICLIGLQFIRVDAWDAYSKIILVNLFWTKMKKGTLINDVLDAFIYDLRTACYIELAGRYKNDPDISIDFFRHLAVRISSELTKLSADRHSRDRSFPLNYAHVAELLQIHSGFRNNIFVDSPLSKKNGLLTEIFTRQLFEMYTLGFEELMVEAPAMPRFPITKIPRCFWSGAMVRAFGKWTISS